MTTPTRRWFVLGAALAALGGLLVNVRWRGPRRSATEDALACRVNRLANSSRELSKLGERQRSRLASRAEPHQLLQNLGGGLTLEQMSALSDDQLEELLRGSTELDFALGRIVVVGGWFLARTEADLCLLAVV